MTDERRLCDSALQPKCDPGDPCDSRHRMTEPGSSRRIEEVESGNALRCVECGCLLVSAEEANHA